ncbi:MAG: TraR/DksA family transcriptional regulator, partial [Candidatus Velamenicoccus archaeovorus]
MGEAAVRSALLERRDGLRAELDELTAVPRDPMTSVSFGKRIGDGTTEAVERLATTSAARSLFAKLQDVERALAKLEDGTYGRCDVCGAAIPRERLEAMPWAVRCVGCA